jgi:hypothetical protein
MKVTPIGKKFGKYAPGDVFEFPDSPAKVFIKLKKLEAVGETYTAPTLTYHTREMTADVDAKGAPWDATLHTSTKLKNSDGTWRKKPGRAAA